MLLNDLSTFLILHPFLDSPHVFYTSEIFRAVVIGLIPQDEGAQVYHIHLLDS